MFNTPDFSNLTSPACVPSYGVQLEAEFDKRQAENERGSRTNKIPEQGDLVFLRRIPNLKYDEAEKKKGDQSVISRRLQYYASPKVYRVKLKTTYGSYVLMDPDTKEEVEGGPFPPERLICLEDCPFEDPVNKDDPLWIQSHQLILWRLIKSSINFCS